ncbi:CocE/NonD family hydrolase [Arthrobacter sp. I2-34]|uniref:CocE/NonD family hydrolase n=1 Tax=Arthrobacter hankyongi TaxID=2904801 RepID=A0ABS9LE98_9MICC|nr:CocE/NonD family hydrolase [Arthrobacter hankyongi]MCG2624779.1 CocE/NonD family hydrolase [Arthrobacter hankyongi]
MTETIETLTSTSSESAGVPMRDGVVLAATVYRRSSGEPRPVLLVRTPYNEQMSRTLPVAPALEAGFAVVVQNCRGTARSEGELWAFENETQDGLDTIEWLLGQPWSNGQVCMFGPSYLGMSQLAVSGHRPKGLAAIVPIVATHHYRDGLVFNQGALQLGQALGWHTLKTAQTLGERATRGEDVGSQLGAFFAMTRDMESSYRTLPLTALSAISDVLPSWTKWLEQETEPDYWKRISYADRRTRTEVPALHVGGWFDLFLRGTLDNFTTISQGAESAEARANQHLIIGPWTHADYTGAAGELFFGAGSALAVRLEEQQLRFLRESVDGTPTTLPTVQIFVMGANVWRVENEWPLARTDWQKWYLQPGGGLSPQEPAPGADDDDRWLGFTHDPHHPVPTVGGGTLIQGGPDGGAGYMPGPRDQRGLDARTDILRFTGPVLEQDMEVTGPLRVTLHAATSARDTDFTAKLIDVWPDGRALGVADGIVRARYRHGMDEPAPVEPGQVYEYTIDLAATSQVFKKGHRLRVDIASSNFPCYDRNSGSGKPAGDVTAEDFTTAEQQIFCSAAHPSYIHLPVIPSKEK